MLNWYVDKESLDFILELIKKNEIKSILEIGLGHGHSAKKFAKIVERVVSIEKSKWMIKKYLEDVDEKDRKNIEVIHGDALKVLDNLEEKFDLIFIDGSSNEYPEYLEKSLKLAKRFIIADNTISHKDRLTKFLKEVKKLDYEETGLGKGLIVIKI